MKQIICLLSVVVLTFCSKNTTHNSTFAASPETIVKENVFATETSKKIELEDTTNYDFATYYVVVADTSLDYFYLRDKMVKLNKQLLISIDTMGRYYNKNKNRIVLPENDPDEMYAGDYYPRRNVADYLSLEYMGVYKSKTRDNNIALVTGIYDLEKRADSALRVIKNKERKAFKIKASVYVGCLH